MSWKTLSLLVSLLSVSHLASCRTARDRCSCGSAPSEVFQYDGMPADTFFPAPSVLDVSRTGEQEIVRVTYSVYHRDGKDEEVVIHTADGGRTWVKDRQRPSGPLEISRPPLVYRFVEGDVLERSTDGGNHWGRPQLRINGRSPGEFTRELTARDDAHLQVSLAAVHPQNPTTIYGCFQVLFGRKKESGVVERMPQELPGIHVSSDAGDNWSLLSSELRGFSSEGYCTLGINPSNPNMMIAHGRRGVVISRDGGRKWNPVGQQAELERPAPLKGYAEALAERTRRGLELERQWPFDWTYLIITQIEFDPHSEKAVYLVTNKGVFKSEDGTRSWCLLDAGIWTLLGVGPLYIDPTNPKRIFLGTNKRVLVSEDAGCHFRTFFDWEQYSQGH